MQTPCLCCETLVHRPSCYYYQGQLGRCPQHLPLCCSCPLRPLSAASLRRLHHVHPETAAAAVAEAAAPMTEACLQG